MLTDACMNGIKKFCRSQSLVIVSFSYLLALSCLSPICVGNVKQGNSELNAMTLYTTLKLFLKVA